MADLVVEVVLVDFDCTPGAALVLVVVDDLVVPEGVVIVLDLLALVADLVVVVAVAGFCTVLVVVIFDELVLVAAVGVVWAWADRLPAATNRARI